MEKRLDLQTKSHYFNGIEHISVLGFLPEFHTACNSNGFNEGAAMWLFQYWVRDSVKTTLTERKTTKIGKRKDGNQRKYFQAVNWFLGTYDMEYNIL